MMEKHELELKWLIPIHDQILMVIFRDAALDVLDAELLLNTDPNLMVSRNPEMRDAEYAVPQDIVPEFCQRIGCSKYYEPEDGVLVTIDFGEQEYLELLRKCEFYSQGHPNGITPQKLVLALCRFLVIPENQDAVHAWVATWKSRKDHPENDRQDFQTVTRQQIETDCDAVLAMLKECGKPVLILDGDKPDAVLIAWEDFWRRFGVLYPEGERERVEAACRLKHEQEQSRPEERT